MKLNAVFAVDFQEAVFDKSLGTLHITSQNFLQKFIYTNAFNRSGGLNFVKFSADDSLCYIQVIALFTLFCGGNFHKAGWHGGLATID